MNYPVSVNFEYQPRLSRLTTFFRITMIVPHYIALYGLGIATSIVQFITWWAILFIGRYPQWAYFFVTGYIRWYTRVSGYFFFVTDKYPPFKLTP